MSTHMIPRSRDTGWRGHQWVGPSPDLTPGARSRRHRSGWNGRGVTIPSRASVQEAELGRAIELANELARKMNLTISFRHSEHGDETIPQLKDKEMTASVLLKRSSETLSESVQSQRN